MKLLIRFLLAALVLAVFPTTDVLAQANRITGPQGSTSTPPKKKPPKKKPTQTTTPSKPTQPTRSRDQIIAEQIDNMVYVEGGTFQMGSNDSYADIDEKPVHQVTLSSYSISRYEVTQELWQAVMGNNPSDIKGPKRPVEQVSWNDCQDFIQRLNSLTGRNFRLPTEAEWEYAARGGQNSQRYKYSGSNSLGDVAWCGDNSGYHTHDVGIKRANELGLYDMTGNVEEWCQDWIGNYNSSAQTNPQGPSSGSLRVHRGGGWRSLACRVSLRSYDDPSFWCCDLGLRLAE